jgi:L-alanine-DL-glutamate epimerase-like enolase superfamily enzyme
MSTVEALEVSAFTIPTDAPESDGTLEWDSTTIVVVEARSGATRGLGWTYAPEAAGRVVKDLLAGVVRGRSLEGLTAIWLDCGAQLRNAGRPGVAFCALSAVDLALWDLRARLLDVPLVSLLPAARDRVSVYGSGGFCSYSLERLGEQLAGWVERGIPRVKMKLGRDPRADPARLDAARAAIGDADLCVDANGAFATKEAVRWAARYVAEWHVRWFEEPSLTPHFAQ